MGELTAVVHGAAEVATATGDDGEAALAGLLQSCSVLSVVNVDAGFTAGTQAALIARAVDEAAESTS